MLLTKKLAIGGLNGFVAAEVQNSTFVLRLSGSAKIPPIANFPTVSGHFKTTTQQTTFDEQIDNRKNGNTKI